ERVVVVLVDHDPVEAGLGAVHELVEVHRVELARPLGAEVLVGEHEVVVAAPTSLLLRIGRIAHLGKEVDLLDYGSASSRATGAASGIARQSRSRRTGSTRR